MLKKIRIPKIILPILILSIVLNIFRVFFFDTQSFVYILWNIFLSAVSFITSSIILLYINKDNFYNPLFIFGFLIWILFLPNAPYVITDFIHLGEIRTVPLIYDIILLFVSSTASLLFGLYSMEQMEKVFSYRFSKKTVNGITLLIIFFTSFGIYLGRSLRFNSWDFFLNYNALFKSVVDIFVNPSKHTNAYFYTIIFFFLILVCYKSFKNRWDDILA